MHKTLLRGQKSYEPLIYTLFHAINNHYHLVSRKVSMRTRECQKFTNNLFFLSIEVGQSLFFYCLVASIKLII